MKLYHWTLLAILVASATWLILKTSNIDPRAEILLDVNWKFSMSDDPAASEVDFDDSGWRVVSVPHDWMIEQDVNQDNPSGTATGFYPGGVGWYRKHFDISAFENKQKFQLVFDGVYMNADVWLNGKHIGKHTYGYIGFTLDVTPYIRKDTINILAVRTDCSNLPVDRWYSGAGIYRDVTLVATENLHFPVHNTTITTTNTENGTLVRASILIRNSDDRQRRFKIKSDLIAPDGTLVKSLISSRSADAGETVVIEESHLLEDPELWSPDDPALYELHSFLLYKKKLADDQHQKFGVRSIRFDPDRGFLLNGKKEILKGVCLHHDGGAMGAAVPDATWEYRLKTLKDLGVNALRLAHNPHDPAVLDLCDRMGFLVINEMYDKWEMNWRGAKDDINIEENYVRDLTYFVNRDRNHPSVILWSVGNETIEQLDNPELGVTWYLKLMNLTQQLDTTRQVTCGLHPGNPERGHEVPSGFIHVSPVVSYNYRTDSFAAWHEKYPQMVWIASETKAYNTSWDTDFSELDYTGNSWFDLDTFVAGQFIWAGIDYLGESRGWPDRGFRNGLIRTDGHVKPYAYFTQSLYSKEPMVKLSVYDQELADSLTSLETWQISWAGAPVSRSWNFAGKAENVELNIFSNCDSVSVALNGELIDTYFPSAYPARVIKERVKYAEGILTANGFSTAEDGSVWICTDTLKTAGTPVRIQMLPDRNRLLANGRDVVHIKTHVEDASGIAHPDATNLIRYDLQGPGRIRIVDNGNPADHSGVDVFSKRLYRGTHTLIIQSTFEPGDLIISASSDGLENARLKVKSVRPEN